MAQEKHDDKLEKALAYFQAGKSPRECEKLTGINYKKVDREAKKRGLEKGSLSQLISDKTRVETEIVSLGVAERDIVTKEVNDRLMHIQFFNDVTVKNISMLSKKLTKEISVTDHKMAQEAIAKGKETVLGKQPDTAIQINNGQLLTEMNKEQFRSEARRLINEV